MRRMKRWSLPPLALALGWMFAPVARAGVDLAPMYSAIPDYVPNDAGLDWVCEPRDVWSLASFRFAVGDRLRVELGPSVVVFGRHDKTAVWAWLRPEKPAPLKCAAAGDGESITSIWMRFHPSRVGELFPADTVTGPGPESARVWARRNYYWKIRASWQANDKPMIPSPNSIILDVETAEGNRRFFGVDAQAGTVKAEDDFTRMALPVVKPLSREEALKVFDTVWKAFDEEYAMFTIKPDVDWQKQRDTLRPQVEKAATNYEVADLLAQMIAPLKDLHAYVYCGHEYVPAYTRERPFNASWSAIAKMFPGIEGQDKRRELGYGRTAEGIGYINILGLNNIELADAFDEALEKLADTWGLVLDLRGNGGGDENLGKLMAGRFAEKALIYSFSRYRNGPKHDDLGDKLPRAFEPRGPWRYESPVVVLIGQRTMSSAESFALMLAQCPQVTTMGDRTAGASANPRLIERLPGDIKVNLPRWLDLDPRGEPIEHRGVQPQAKIAASAQELRSGRDSVLEAALEHLRKLEPSARKPGRRSDEGGRLPPKTP